MLAMAIQRYETHHFEDMYYVAGSEQSLHFQQLFKILELLEFPWAPRCHHVPFGRVRGMATRKGKVVFLEDILEESKAHMRQIMLDSPDKQLSPEKIDEVAEKVSLSAIVIQDLQAKRIKEYTFDLKRMTDARGDTGPYLQYTHARLASIERVSKVPISTSVDYSVLVDSAEVFDIVLLLARYEEIIALALEKNEPSTITNHLFEIARLVNAANSSLRVKDKDPRVAESRMVCTLSLSLILIISHF
jgi:arginyl-tRNA synthetase